MMPVPSQKTFSGSYHIPLLISLVVIALLLVVRLWIYLPESLPSSRKMLYKGPSRDLVQQKLDSTLTARGIRFYLQEKSSTRGDLWFIHVPPRFPVPLLHLQLQKSVRSVDAEIIETFSEPVSGQVELKVGWEDSCLIRLRLITEEDERKRHGEIALLIDDFYDRWGELEIGFTNLGIPLNTSIIPQGTRSRQVAGLLSQRACEILLHLPMEPFQKKVSDDGFIIKTGMSSKEIRKRLQRALDVVPGARGVNNHMGSAVTSDPETIGRVLQEVREKGLYFLDSRTAVSTQAYRIAREMGVPAMERSVFIDAVYQESAIREELLRLLNIADQKGVAVGIGHCRSTTLKLLKIWVVQAQEKGYRFVYLSQVMPQW